MPTSQKATKTLQTAHAKTSRRSLLKSSFASLAGVALLPSTASGADDSAASIFLDKTYTDPINHPGGTRRIELTGTGLMGYQLAKVIGGGGTGEPASYELPAMIFPCPGGKGASAAQAGQYCITIDFSPKGGPRDFTGYWDAEQKGIRFILDNNFWPMQ